MRHTSFQAVAYAYGIIQEGMEGELALIEAARTQPTPQAIISLFTQLTMAGQSTLRVLCGLGLNLGQQPLAHRDAEEEDNDGDDFFEDAAMDDADVDSDADDTNRNATHDEPVDDAISDWEKTGTEDAGLKLVRNKMMADFHTGPLPARVQQLLKRLQASFNANDRCPSEYGIPLPDIPDTDVVNKEVARWLTDPFTTTFCENRTLSEQQQMVYNATHAALENTDTRPTFELIYIDGPAGTGKTTTINYIICELRTKSEVCLVGAPTNLAALLYKGGLSVHSLFDLLVSRDVDDIVTSRLTKTAAKAKLIASAKIIVIDELPSLRRADFEAMLQILDFLEFRGVLLLSGDFRQIGGGVPRATGKEQVNASPHSSAAWKHVKTFKLEQRHRTSGDLEWDEHITKLGDGDKSTITGYSQIDKRPLVDVSFARKRISDKEKAVDFVFNGFVGNDDEISRCCILSPHNKNNDEWNTYVQEKRPGFLHKFIGKTEVDGDAGAADGNNRGSLLSPEVIENYHEASAPPHVLELKDGDIVILTRACGRNSRTCSTALACHHRLRRYDRQGERAGDEPTTAHSQMLHTHADRTDHRRRREQRLIEDVQHLPVAHYISMEFVSSLPLTSKHHAPLTYVGAARMSFPDRSQIMIARTQFPVRLAYAMTFNKAQGQTLNRVLVDLTSGGAFSHGHLYVAMSRVRHGDNLAVFVDKEDEKSLRLHTAHIVHHELLFEGEALEEVKRTYAEQLRTVRALSNRCRMGARSDFAGRYSGPVRFLADGTRVNAGDAHWRKNNRTSLRTRQALVIAIRERKGNTRPPATPATVVRPSAESRHSGVQQDGPRFGSMAALLRSYAQANGHTTAANDSSSDEDTSLYDAEFQSELYDPESRRFHTRGALTRMITARQQPRLFGAQLTNQMVSVVSWGVLGAGPGYHQQAGRPNTDIVIVDPAGLRYIKTAGPRGAGGLSKEIYKFIKINNHSQFPPEVRANIHAEGDVAFRSYAPFGSVLHVASPDLSSIPDRRRAVRELTKAYTNVLRAFAKTRMRCLRMPVIAGGIFAGTHRDHMLQMTSDALHASFAALPSEANTLHHAHIELCVYGDNSRVQSARTALGSLVVE